MIKFSDIRLAKDSKGNYDLAIAEDGDISWVEGYETAIQMSVLCERRASSDVVPLPNMRRGWLGNEDGETAGFEIGSLIWLYYQQRLTSSTKVGIEVAATDALQWFLDDNLVEDIIVNTVIDKDKISLDVEFSVTNAPVETKNFVLWERTRGDEVAPYVPTAQVPPETTFMAAYGGLDSPYPEGRGYTPELPWATSAYAFRNTPAGRTLGLNEGTYWIETFFGAPFGNGRSASSWEPRKATLLQTDASLYTAAFGTSYANPETITMSGFVIDSAGLADDCVILTNGAEMSEFVLSDIEFKNPIDSAFQCNKQSGTVTVDGCSLDFQMASSIVDGAFFAGEGDFYWNITNNSFTSTVDDPDVAIYIGGTRAASPAGEYECRIQGNMIDLDVTVNTVDKFFIVQPLGADYIELSDNTVRVTSASTYEMSCLRVFGESGSEVDDLLISGNSVYTTSEASFGIAVGQGDDEGYVKNAVVENNVAIGKYFASNSPHNFAQTHSRSTDTWVMRENYSAVSFIGFLVAQSDSASSSVVEDNLSYDCYGAHYYAKGNTDATIQNNRAVHSDKYQRRSFGMLHATKQDSDDNIDTQFLTNTVVMQSKAKGFALAGTSLSGGVSQNATFIGNKYYVPDTLDDSDLLFIIDNAFKTPTEWFAAHPLDADDGQGGQGLIYLPQADIDAMVEEAEAEVVAAYGAPIPE